MERNVHYRNDWKPQNRKFYQNLGLRHFAVSPTICGQKLAHWSRFSVSGNCDKFQEILVSDWGNLFFSCGSTESAWSITCHYTRYYTIVVVSLILVTHMTDYISTYLHFPFLIVQLMWLFGIYMYTHPTKHLNEHSSATNRHDFTIPPTWYS